MRDSDNASLSLCVMFSSLVWACYHHSSNTTQSTAAGHDDEISSWLQVFGHKTKNRTHNEDETWWSQTDNEEPGHQTWYECVFNSLSNWLFFYFSCLYSLTLDVLLLWWLFLLSNWVLLLWAVFNLHLKHFELWFAALIKFIQLLTLLMNTCPIQQGSKEGKWVTAPTTQKHKV